MLKRDGGRLPMQAALRFGLEGLRVACQGPKLFVLLRANSFDSVPPVAVLVLFFLNFYSWEKRGAFSDFTAFFKISPKMILEGRFHHGFLNA